MFLGHLLSTEDLTADEPSKPICGECEKCIEACPTKAIEEPKLPLPKIDTLF